MVPTVTLAAVILLVCLLLIDIQLYQLGPFCLGQLPFSPCHPAFTNSRSVLYRAFASLQHHRSSPIQFLLVTTTPLLLANTPTVKRV